MLLVRSPKIGFAERDYVIRCILQERLGLAYDHRIDEELHDATIIAQGESEIHIPLDPSFRSRENRMWSKEDLPKGVHSLSPGTYNKEEIAVFYGEPELNVHNDKINLRFDLLACVFFCLSRWEETVIDDRDEHARPLESSLFLVRHELHFRPVVEEWSQFLASILKIHFSEITPRPSTFSIWITHDVDHLRRFDQFSKMIRAVGGDFMLRKKPMLALSTIRDYVQIRTGLKKDNYDTFDDLMNVSEFYGLKSRFYFIPSRAGEMDARYDIREKAAKTAIDSILARGHVVGMHGSYSSWNNESVFSEELNRLLKLSHSITEGRQHYLRFKNPDTWRQWNSAGMTHDSTMGLYEDIGFRAGTCKPFRVFDIEQRRELDLMEVPLSLMEVPLIKKYRSVATAYAKGKEVIDQCKKHDGTFVFLWHPENFNHPFWGAYRSLYFDLLDYATRMDSNSARVRF